jgi:DOPA 4,5-dioxygenase
MGRWRDEPVGPHPQPMYQVKFDPEEFARIVPWLMLNRDGLNILVHPETTDAYTDHAVSALWLGEKLALRLDVLRNLKAAR